MSVISGVQFDAIVKRMPQGVCETPDFMNLAEEFGVTVDTLTSIHGQLCQRFVKMNHHVHKGRTEEYCKRYNNGESICSLSELENFPPCLLTRLILEGLQLGISKTSLKDIMNNPARLPEFIQVDYATEAAERLQANVEEARYVDRMYSPMMDTVRRISGVEYEALLCEKLRQLDAPFWSEDTLRKKGFIKTPDVKLQVPFAVGDRIVHWIDSKATFGDEKSHRNQYMEQYQQYVNRYGPGMVIYWFGYVRELQDDDNILLVEDFPPEIHQLKRFTTK